MGIQTTAKFEFTKEAQTLVNILTDYSEEMESHEREFLEGLQEKFNRFGDETFISDKQIGWLRSMERRYAR